jgi:hypothetical protein
MHCHNKPGGSLNYIVLSSAQLLTSTATTIGEAYYGGVALNLACTVGHT